MGKPVVRLRTLTINGIKNVKSGQISMPYCFNNQYSFEKAEILGLYGQNGSGKTAVVDAMNFIQVLFSGKNLTAEFADYIDTDSKESTVTAEFAIYFEHLIYDITYIVKLHKTTDENIEITRESLHAAKDVDGSRSSKTTLISYSRTDGDQFAPKKRYSEFLKVKPEARIELVVAKKLAEKINCSYIFGENSRNIFVAQCSKDSPESLQSFAPIINSLFNFAIKDLFVIKNEHSGLITANIALPLAFRVDKKSSGMKGDIAVSLRKPTVLSDSVRDVLDKIIDEINSVLVTIIPGMTIIVRDLGKQTMTDGNEGHSIELLSEHKGKLPIPIRMESEGIIKIVSILSAMIQLFSNPSICLVIDEMDSGIFEFLFGELLDISAKSAKGQLIFTSHNMRPLEMLDKDCIMFSTSNPNHRYTHMRNVKNTNNLRDFYIRSITLGGQNDELYDETDSLKIARAFRKAGRRIVDDQT